MCRSAKIRPMLMEQTGPNQQYGAFGHRTDRPTDRQAIGGNTVYVAYAL